MKLIVFLMGLGALLAVTGCESDEHHHYHGGVYDDSYRHYGYGAYPYDYDHRQWEHRDWRY